MTNPTSNFGWQMPTSTDLVTDLPADFEVFGQAVDTSLADLKGGTTGQVLSKASNTDMDFSWTNADPLTILDAKGDLITATAADTPARLASSGVNNQVLTVDTSTATGLKWAAVSAGPVELATASLAGVSTYTFSSISGSYKTLFLRLTDSYDSLGNYILMRINGSTTGNYSRTRVNADQATNGTTTGGSSWVIALNTNDITSGTTGFEFYFPNYASTTMFKSYYGWSMDGGTPARWQVGVNSNGSVKNAALSSITLICDGGNWSAGTATLYGVN